MVLIWSYGCWRKQVELAASKICEMLSSVKESMPLIIDVI